LGHHAVGRTVSLQATSSMRVLKLYPLPDQRKKG
jgi:hypothetical protein